MGNSGVKFILLWIEGKNSPTSNLIPKLRNKGFGVVTVSTGKEALARLREVDPDLVVVDAASMRTSGKRICQSIRNKGDGLPILLIANPKHAAVGDVEANKVLHLPFTIRKLVNRIMPLLPAGGASTMMVGPIELNMERRQVRCGNKEAHLTPRLARLLQTLLTRPGEVIEREQLFRTVWKTEYTGDTRTLDVHISWLRKAIEEDPRKPMYLKTIRGLGYRIDVEQ